MLLAGEIDIAPISSIEYAPRLPLRLMPRLCVSSEGASTRSTRDAVPLAGALRRRTPESATSVVLTRVLIPQAELLPLEAAPSRREAPDRDAALKSAFEDPPAPRPRPPVLERTGLPMVFAVWPPPLVDGLLELQDLVPRPLPSEPDGSPRGERALRLPAGSSPVTSKLRYSFPRSGRASTRSSRWPTSATRHCPSCLPLGRATAPRLGRRRVSAGGRAARRYSTR